MAQRTTLDKVKAILPTSTTLTDPQIQAAIDAAVCVVDQAVESCAANQSADCLAQIETYLASHFAAVTENTLTLSSEKSVCGGEVKYGFKFGDGILGTPFGQMANTLSSGCLAEFDKQPIQLLTLGSHGGSV